MCACVTSYRQSSPVPELSISSRPYIGAEPGRAKRRVQDNLHAHAQNEPIKNYQAPNLQHRQRVSNKSRLRILVPSATCLLPETSNDLKLEVIQEYDFSWGIQKKRFPGISDITFLKRSRPRSKQHNNRTYSGSENSNSVTTADKDGSTAFHDLLKTLVQKLKGSNVA